MTNKHRISEFSPIGHDTYIKYGHVVFEVSSQFIGRPDPWDNVLFDFTDCQKPKEHWVDEDGEYDFDPAKTITPDELLGKHFSFYEEHLDEGV